MNLEKDATLFFFQKNYSSDSVKFKVVEWPYHTKLETN